MQITIHELQKRKKVLLSKMKNHVDKSVKMVFDEDDKWGLDIELFDFIYDINEKNDNIITSCSNMGCKNGNYDGMMLSYDGLNYTSHLRLYFLEKYEDSLNIKLSNINFKN